MNDLETALNQARQHLRSSERQLADLADWLYAALQTLTVVGFVEPDCVTIADQAGALAFNQAGQSCTLTVNPIRKCFSVEVLLPTSQSMWIQDHPARNVNELQETLTSLAPFWLRHYTGLRKA